MNRGHILRELVLEQLKALVEDGIIQINDKLKYNADKNFTDPLDIPSLGYIQALIEQGGSETLRRTFLIPASDIVNGSVSLIGRTNQQNDTKIPSDPTQTIYEKGLNGKTGIFVKSNAQFDQDGEVSGLDGSFDVLVVLNGVEPVAPVYVELIRNGETEEYTIEQDFDINENVTSVILKPIALDRYLNVINQNLTLKVSNSFIGLNLVTIGFSGTQSISALPNLPSQYLNAYNNSNQQATIEITDGTDEILEPINEYALEYSDGDNFNLTLASGQSSLFKTYLNGVIQSAITSVGPFVLSSDNLDKLSYYEIYIFNT